MNYKQRQQPCGAVPWEETGQDICAAAKVFPRGCSGTAVTAAPQVCIAGTSHASGSVVERP